MTTFGELNTGDMFRYVSNGNAAGAVYRKSSPRDAVQQRQDGTGDMHSVDALVKTRATTKVQVVPQRTATRMLTKSEPLIRFDDFTSGSFKPTVTGFVEEVRTTETDYSFIVSASEWEVVTTYTGRQDGRMAWQVALVQVDGNVDTLKGLDKYAEAADKINAAIFQLTRAARWIQPLNAFAKG